MQTYLNAPDRSELREIIPEEGKYKMSSVYYDQVLKAKAFYLLLYSTAFRNRENN